MISPSQILTKLAEDKSFSEFLNQCVIEIGGLYSQINNGFAMNIKEIQSEQGKKLELSCGEPLMQVLGSPISNHNDRVMDAINDFYSGKIKDFLKNSPKLAVTTEELKAIEIHFIFKRKLEFPSYLEKLAKVSSQLRDADRSLGDYYRQLQVLKQGTALEKKRQDEALSVKIRDFIAQLEKHTVYSDQAKNTKKLLIETLGIAVERGNLSDLPTQWNMAYEGAAKQGLKLTAARNILPDDLFKVFEGLLKDSNQTQSEIKELRERIGELERAYPTLIRRGRGREQHLALAEGLHPRLGAASPILTAFNSQLGDKGAVDCLRLAAELAGLDL